jgi:hypothetical protein
VFSLRSLRLFLATFAVKDLPYLQPDQILNRKGRKEEPQRTQTNPDGFGVRQAKNRNFGRITRGTGTLV